MTLITMDLNLTRILISCLIIISCVTTTSGQLNWPPMGASWYYNEGYAFSGDIGFSKIESIGDTIINGKFCKILTKSKIQGCSGRPYIEYFHMNDTGEVFFYESNLDDFQKLFDFDADLGEKWTIHLPLDRDTGSQIVDSVTYTVDSISMIRINEYDLKVFHTSIEFHEGIFEFNRTSKYIENIGDIGYFFPWTLWYCDANVISGLRCYQDPVIGYYETGIVDSCEYKYKWTRVSNEENQDEMILVYPNPVSHGQTVHITLIYLLTQPRIEIYNALGQEVDVCILEGEVAEFDAPDRPGMYFIRVMDEDGLVESRKIIVQ